MSLPNHLSQVHFGIIPGGRSFSAPSRFRISLWRLVQAAGVESTFPPILMPASCGGALRCTDPAHSHVWYPPGACLVDRSSEPSWRILGRGSREQISSHTLALGQSIKSSNLPFPQATSLTSPRQYIRRKDTCTTRSHSCVLS